MTLQAWLRGRAGNSQRPAPPVRTRSGGLTPPGPPAPHPSFAVDIAVLEGRLRRVTADELGVDPAELTDEVSLTDDLAADSLDVLELLMAVESEIGVSIPMSVLADVRTYGDLVAVVADAAGCRRGARIAIEPDGVRARVTAPGVGHVAVERAGRLTPYAAETIAEDALYAGRGARLDVEVPPGLTDAEMTSVADRFAHLGPRGVEVHVRRRAAGVSIAPRPHVASTGS